jgi:hypothetical protein
MMSKRELASVDKSVGMMLKRAVIGFHESMRQNVKASVDQCS